MEPVKCVVVGDKEVGKSSLLISYTANCFSPNNPRPSSFDTYFALLCVDGKNISLGMWDTAAEDEYDRLRLLAYPETDVFLVCFSVDSIASYNNVKAKWIPEIKRNCPNTPVILVATKSDLKRTKCSFGEKLRLISSPKGRKLAKKIGAISYAECSSFTRQGVTALFDTSIRATFLQKRKGTGKIKAN